MKTMRKPQNTPEIIAYLMRVLEEALLTEESAMAQSFNRWLTLFGESLTFDRDIDERKRMRLYRSARSMGATVNSPEELRRLFFCIHSLMAFLVKFHCWRALAFKFGPVSGGPSLEELPNLADADLLSQLKQMEEGLPFRSYGLINFPEDDLFNWYIGAWDEDIARTIRGLLLDIFDQDPAIYRDASNDLFGRLYHNLFIREMRHNLGEYYTPGWLARYLLGQIDGRLFDPQSTDESLFALRWIDPACGSAIFLLLVLRQLIHLGTRLGIPSEQLLFSLIRNVVGIDISPLAILMARANYIVTIADLLGARAYDVAIPIYCGDSILAPFSDQGQTDTRTSRLFDCAIENSPSDQGKIDMKALGLFDYVIGNPPWISWEYLPLAYRKQTLPLWLHYRLKGDTPKEYRSAGGSKLDIALLMTYVAADKYLKMNGRLGFILPQAVLKTSWTGYGFRRFAIAQDGGRDIPLRVIMAEDMTPIRVFEGARSHVVIIILTKDGTPTRYPIPYLLWKWKKKKVPGQPRRTSQIEPIFKKIKREIVRHPLVAVPQTPNDYCSQWLTTTHNSLRALEKIQGIPAYKPHQGVDVNGFNGIFFVEKLREYSDGLVEVQNIVAASKSKVPQVSMVVESELLYPLLRGRNIWRWQASPESYIIIPYVRTNDLFGGLGPFRILSISELRTRYPHTYNYLKTFAGPHRIRKMNTLNGITYAVAPWKVVWRAVGNKFVCAVATNTDKLLIPGASIIFIGLECELEAYYVSAVLNSTPARLWIQGSCTNVHKDENTAGQLAIPLFRSTRLHKRLAYLGEAAHNATATEDIKALIQIEAAIDEAVAELWGLKPQEMQHIYKALEILLPSEDYIYPSKEGSTKSWPEVRDIMNAARNLNAM